MPIKLILFILAGSVAMYGVMLIYRKNFGLSLLKALFLDLLLTVSGVLSVMLMFFFENGYFGGVSFFGAIFFVPLFLLPVSLILKTKYTDCLDISAPAIAVMLAVMKINCLTAGCCGGMIINQAADGSVVRFPSQICEMITALIISVVLVLIIKSGLLQSRIFPCFMILYGCVRFALNLFRETENLSFGLGIGNLWAIISFAIGVIWLILVMIVTKRKKDLRSVNKSRKNEY